MIPRLAAATLQRLARGFPVLAVTGPRQSGKTTLARALFADRPYATLENPESRRFASEDPKAFLAQFPEGAVLDEVQRVPELLSWIQGLVDERKKMADFIITGSAQFELVEQINQSLAGRVGRVELLPFQGAELLDANLLNANLDEYLVRGGYPALYSREIGTSDWFSNYVATYIERDVRQLTKIKDLALFQRFMRLAAGRSGQLLNLANLGADAGVSQPTARQWITVLEASYLVMRLPPYFENLNKRLVKAHKLYFLDTGLLCWLLGIHTAEVLANHPLRGAIFESMVVVDHLKRKLNAGVSPTLHFWRDSHGQEVDLLEEVGQRLDLTEIKAGQTFASDWTKPMEKIGALLDKPDTGKSLTRNLVYGGQGEFERNGVKVKGWMESLSTL